jgi:hypothetical protein
MDGQALGGGAQKKEESTGGLSFSSAAVFGLSIRKT